MQLIVIEIVNKSVLNVQRANADNNSTSRSLSNASGQQTDYNKKGFNFIAWLKENDLNNLYKLKNQKSNKSSSHLSIDHEDEKTYQTRIKSSDIPIIEETINHIQNPPITIDISERKNEVELLNHHIGMYFHLPVCSLPVFNST